MWMSARKSTPLLVLGACVASSALLEEKEYFTSIVQAKSGAAPPLVDYRGNLPSRSEQIKVSKKFQKHGKRLVKSTSFILEFEGSINTKFTIQRVPFSILSV